MLADCINDEIDAIDRSLGKNEKTAAVARIIAAIVTVSGTDQSKVEITIHAENRCFDDYKPMTFFEYDGYIAMEAEHFCNKQDSADGCFSLLKPYGKTGSAMKVYPSLTDCSLTRRFEKPYLEYRFVTNTDGIYQLTQIGRAHV
mgnify:CR=1 FL=1